MNVTTTAKAIATHHDRPIDECWACAKQTTHVQRCHVVPAALGGTDTPDNLVLLCADCHVEAPDVADPGEMWHWIRNHPFSTERYVRVVQRAFGRAERMFGRDAVLAHLRASDVDLLTEEAMQRSTSHWGRGVSDATLEWLCLQVISPATTRD